MVAAGRNFLVSFEFEVAGTGTAVTAVGIDAVTMVVGTGVMVTGRISKFDVWAGAVVSSALVGVESMSNIGAGVLGGSFDIWSCF